MKDLFTTKGFGQTPERILSKIAQKIVDPDNLANYRGDSCYGQCSLAIAAMIKADNLPDGMEIVILGTKGGLAVHTLLANESGTIFLDTENRDFENIRKIDDDYPDHTGRPLMLMARVSMLEFQSNYLNPVREHLSGRKKDVAPGPSLSGPQ